MTNDELPLVSQLYLLQKYSGKGGWTYAAIPEIAQDKHAPFGWVTVKGTIDDHCINHYKLMPMGNGQLFLPVKTDIRKKIGKQAGDWVMVTLYADNGPVPVPEEFLECLSADPAAEAAFHQLTNSQKKQYLDWIYAAKTTDTQANRIAQTLDQLVQNG